MGSKIVADEKILRYIFMLLYCFLSHQHASPEFQENIHKMMRKLEVTDYLIFMGGYGRSEFDPKSKVLKLNSSDLYEGLPEKICSMFSFLVQDSRFSQYSHFIKLDHDMVIKQPYNISDIKHLDYAGRVKKDEPLRDYHLGRCSEGSYFNDHIYEGDHVPYCFGGLSYIVSRKAAQVITDSNKNYEKEIYEDLYIAKLLHKQNIFPQEIGSLMRRHILSQDHNYLLLSRWEKLKLILQNPQKYAPIFLNYS